MAWYPGQENGNALAQVLFGDVNPSAKLPVTIPASASQVPTSTTAQLPGVNLPRFLLRRVAYRLSLV